MDTMGDCGSFSYLTEPTPPFSVDEVIEFYLDAQFDYGISLDHVILGYDERSKSLSEASEEWRDRFEITLQCANDFFSKCQTRKVPFCPVGAAQGWSPQSYAVAVSELQKMGYQYIALGGMVPLKSREILACLEAVNEVRNPQTKLHLLGINRLDALDEFARMGVHSFDSTSALKKAFMDDKENYHTKAKAYTAVRVPQVGENAALKKKILAGTVDHARARFLEKTCMDGLKALGQNNIELTEVLGRLREYDILWRDGKDETERYRETLQDAPWRKCACSICRDLGVHVVIFRGADRNRSRGFHNLHVLGENLREWTARNQST
jgi:queuine/archaeosine tRNA-ribosyltransferase